MKRLEKTFKEFSKTMLKKLREKEREGFHGWEEMNEYAILRKINSHLFEDLMKKGVREEVDIANLCMFLWYVRNKKKKQGGGDVE